MMKGAEDAIAQITSVNEATTKLHDMRVSVLLDAQAQLRIQIEKTEEAFKAEKEKNQMTENEVLAANARVATLEAEVSQLSKKLQEPVAFQDQHDSEVASELTEEKERHQVTLADATAAKAQAVRAEAEMTRLQGLLDSQAQLVEQGERELQ